MNLLFLQIDVSVKERKLGIELVNLGQFCVAYMVLQDAASAFELCCEAFPSLLALQAIHYTTSDEPVPFPCQSWLSTD